MKNKIIIISAIVITLIVTLSILEHIFVTVPEERETQRSFKIINAKTTYEYCEKDAINAYSIDWDNQCAINGEKNNCGLDNNVSDGVNQRLKEKKDRCFDNYKLELSLIK